MEYALSDYFKVKPIFLFTLAKLKKDSMVLFITFSNMLLKFHFQVDRRVYRIHCFVLSHANDIQF